MLTKDLQGLVRDAEQLRQKKGQNYNVISLCAIIEALLTPEMVLAMAESILRERKIVSTEFCNATHFPDEYEYDAEGEVVKIMVQADEDAKPIDLGDHESLVHAYHKAPEPRPSSAH